MKNKKLFAILTLVCFMFTLMPVAAFAAVPAPGAAEYTFDSEQVYVTEVSVALTTEDNIELVTTNAALNFEAYVGDDATTGTSVTASGYVFYVADEAGDVVAITTDGVFDITFEQPGDYEVHAIKLPDNADADKVAGILTDITSPNKKVQDFKDYAGKTGIIEGFATVTYDAPDMVYRIVLAADKTAKTGSLVRSSVTEDTTGSAYSMDIEASEGWNKDGGVVATLQQALKGTSVTTNAGWSNVKAGYELKIETAGYVDVSATKLTTNNKGQASFVVTSDLANAGNKVVVKYGTAKTYLTVDAYSATLADVEVVNAPVAPQNNTKSFEAANVEFKFTDVNGIATELEFETDANARTFTDGVVDLDASDVVITLVEKPAKSKLTSADFGLEKQVVNSADPTRVIQTADIPGVYTLVCDETPDKDGTYVVKVALKNGASATATVKFAEMGEPVKLMFVKAPATVAYGESTAAATILAAVFDANGVMDTATVNYSASGLAVDTFTNGFYPTLTIENDDKYIGATVTLMAVYGGDELVATKEIQVVDKAATVAYTSTKAEVGVSTTLVGQIKDASGKVAPITTGATVSFVILEKPENAIVVASNAVGTGLKDGNVMMNFMASQAGEYKVQTIVVEDGTNKYITGIETITVGGGVNTFNDVVVVSMGANSMIVNDKVVALDVAPYITEGRTMLQFNVLGNFGIDVQWDEATRSVIAEGNGVKVVLTIDSKVATVNGKAVTLDVAATIANGRTVVPVGFITGNFGITPTFTYNADGTIADILFTK